MDLIHPLTEEQINALFSKIGYSEEKLKEDLDHLREWLKQQEHLPPARLTETDEFLQFYLTACKGNLEKTKLKLDSYYTYRSKSEIFDKRDPLRPELKFAADLCEFAIMPNATKEGVRIVYLSLKTSDTTNFDHCCMIRKIFNYAELVYRMEKYHVGFYIILNFENATLSHLLTMKLQIVKDAVLLLQEVVPARIQCILALNAPYFFEITLNNVVLPFLNKKMRKRITSKGVEILDKILDIKLFPKDFGGDEESLQVLNYKWKHKEMQKRELYINELSQHTDETKRKTNDNYERNGFTRRIKSYIGSMIPQWKKVENIQK